MAGKSSYLETALLNHVLGGSAYTAPSTLYIALFTAAPSDAGGGTEVSGGSYARASSSPWTPTAGNTISNSGDIDFPTATGSWGTVTHFGIFDASSSGNLLYWAALSSSISVGNGDLVQFLAGDIIVGED